MIRRVALSIMVLLASVLVGTRVLALEGAEPFKVKEVLLWASEDPNYNVDITDVFDMKVKALRCHDSQVGAAPLVEMEERIKERSRMYAEGENYELAESFHRVELFR